MGHKSAKKEALQIEQELIEWISESFKEEANENRNIRSDKK